MIMFFEMNWQTEYSNNWTGIVVNSSAGVLYIGSDRRMAQDDK